MKNAVNGVKEKSLKINKRNVWLYVSMVLGVCLVISLTWGRLNFGMSSITGSTVNYLNENVLQGTQAVAQGQEEVSGVYLVKLNINDKDYNTYVTKDGKLFFPEAIDMSRTVETDSQQQVKENIPKSDKPVVELFVMSFCPFGVKAENNILPIVELLKDKIDFKIKYIVTVSGDSIDTVDSLHGINEAKEDARQLTVLKYYPDKFYDYLKDINNNCYPVSSDADALDACWKAAAEKLKIDVKKIETAAYGSEGIELLKLSEADAKKYNAGSSPTLIINGAKSSSIYSGTSTTQTAICNAFNSAPSECSQVVAASSTSTPSGSCN